MFKHWKDDLPASIVVFLVAMPLCLGIALASGAPLFSGIISGVIGGIVVGALSGSPLGVSGPAAGLAVIVLNAITDLGSFDIFLVAVILAGIIQVIMGYLRAGIIAYFFPSSVIHGMLAGIGVLIILKQIPHAFGYDKEPEGMQSFVQVDHETTFHGLVRMLDHIHPGVIIVSLVSLAILILWDKPFLKKFKFTKLIQGPLIAVVLGIVLKLVFDSIPAFAIDATHLVNLPVADSFTSFLSNFAFPNFKGLLNPNVYMTAIVIAVVASLETLLCVEASDKQDTLKRVTPTNRELKAQGIGNIVSGFIGGLPITQVIVRSSVNQQSGGKTKLSSILHGFLLLISVMAIPWVLNMIPLGVLAAILLVVGYKLAKPSLFIKIYKEGMGQFFPFVVTIVGIVLTDLLMGIGVGIFIAGFIILRNNYKVPFNLKYENLNDKEVLRIVLSEDVSFLNKASLLKTLSKISDGTSVEIDARYSKFIHFDVLEIIENFKLSSEFRNINVTTIDLNPASYTTPLTHFKLSRRKK